MSAILDEVQEDAKAFADWARLRNYSVAQIEDEMTDYIDDMINEGKFIHSSIWTTSHGWSDLTEYYVSFSPSDDANTVYVVAFVFSHLLNGIKHDSTTDAYDRAMKGI